MEELSKAEEIVLLAIWRVGKNADGVTIRQQIKKDTGKLYTYGTLYGLLRQLGHKGHLQKKIGPLSQGSRGRRKTYFSLSRKGRDALTQAFKFHRLVWKDIEEGTFGQT